MKTRFFDSRTEDEGSVYAVGNGRVMAYGHGPVWFQAFGPVYSSPNVLSMTFPKEESVQCESSRMPHTGIWIHKMAQGTITDAAPREAGCLVRRFDMAFPLTFCINLHGCSLTVLETGYEDTRFAALLKIPAGAHAYDRYPTRTDMYLIMLLRGDADIAKTDEGYRLMLKGKGELLITGDLNYPETHERAKQINKMSFDALFDMAKNEDEAFYKRRMAGQIPLKAHPQREAVCEAADDVAFLIRAQQSAEGGVQAGHAYHLAYVRDQYGVFRGLCALGCFDEAKQIMRYYAEVYERFGFIANAQSMGHAGIFHIHENDLVEITGYLILQALMLLERTKDLAFFEALRPMIHWALKGQVKSLYKGMLSFNGDETYIAGGIAPRTLMWHGSLEATMLMITGGEKYLAWCEEQHKTEPWMAEANEKIHEARRMFEGNFRREDSWVTNNASRLDGLEVPKYRHGVCLRCRAFGWTHLLEGTDKSIYVCADCLKHQGEIAAPEREEMSIKSVMMMHPYIGADLLPEAYIHKTITSYLAEYRKSGILPSVPKGNQCLGYDFGLLLYATHMEHLEADDLLAHMLKVRDDTGAWVEYYVDNAPHNTRCRPWESGINIEGALTYLKCEV